MADYARTPDGLTPAVVTALTRWVNASLTGGVWVLTDDWRDDAVSLTLTRWLNLVFASGVSDLGMHDWMAVYAVYKMRGMDAVTTALDTWLVLDRPDFAAEHYPGSLAQPLRYAVIVDQWTTRGS